MTLSPSFFRSTGAASVALLYTALTFGVALSPAPAEARGTAAYYTAELAAPAKDTQSIIKGVVWKCNGTKCIAGKSTSRPIVTCKHLAREMGEITAFTAKGKELADDKLAKCNG